jgi:integrase
LRPLFGDVRLRDLDRAAIRAGWAKLTLARSTKNTVHRVLSASLGQAFEDGLIRVNPAAGWTRNKRTAARAAARERPEQAVLSPAEATRLIELAADSMMFAPIALGLATGARRGEIAALTWARLNMQTGDVTIAEALKEISAGDVRSGLTKTGKPRIVKLPTRYLDMLRQWKSRQAQELLKLGVRQSADTPICTRPDGRRLSPNQITDLFTTAAKRLGRPDVHFHSLRHSHASILIAAGEAIPAVSKRLGHGDISTTMRVYAHAIPRDDDGEADRLDKMLGG